MAKITWQGEPGVKTVIYEGQEFTAGEPVTTDNEKLLKACSHNGRFDVEGWDPSAKTDASPPLTPTAGQTSAQKPVDKPGEPVDLKNGPPKTNKL